MQMQIALMLAGAIACASAAPNCGIPCLPPIPVTSCTSTSTAPATCFHGSPTATVYGSATVTATVSVDCHGCEELAITAAHKACPLFIIEPTTTVTIPTSTASTSVCSATPL
ncbi:hypothetical protein N7G274_002487 [Stereocaulon virgatum]|uniref:Uncharacterized protein n=1 Tax=Stereocaulon virgatum TaxID=373712 RepID=A0ABR4AFY3_9LECA